MRACFYIPQRSYRRNPRWLVSLLSLLLFSLACADAQAYTFVVTNLNDSGAGSLRYAMTAADVIPGADSIVFANGLTGTIALTSPLPDLYDDVTLTGPGANLLTIARSSAAGTPYFRILTIDNGTATPPTVSISGLTLSSGSVQGSVGGSGVYNNKATVALTDCVITNNLTTGPVSFSGPLNPPSPPPATQGGGVYNYQGTMTLTRCTISNNVVTNGTANGGGLCNEGGTLTLTDCTLSGNQTYFSQQTVGFGISQGSANGGGIWNSGTLTLTGCTFANNIADFSTFTNEQNGYGPGNGNCVYNAGTINSYQTILASSSPTGGSNVVGVALTSLGYNLSNDASGPNDGATDKFNMDAKLSPLADYGGPTPTHLPLPGSPALDAGDPNFNGNPATDQRGQPRVFNGRVDIGAVERQAIELFANNDAYSVKHDHTLRVSAPGVLANDTGVAPLSAVLVASAANGTLTLNADGSFVYTPNASLAVATNYADSFTYAVQDGSGRTGNVATVVVTILADNSPTLTSSLSATATAGQAWNFTATATDADLPDDALAFSLYNAPYGMSINAATGAITWTPTVEGVATFYIKVTDRYGKYDMRMFTLTVQSDPNAPVSLSITNVALQRTNTNTVTVSFNVVNSGAGKATNLVIARATLGPWQSVLNSAPINLGAGGKQAYTLTFSGVTPLPRVAYPLQIRGTFQTQNTTQALFYGGSVVIP